MKRNNLTTAVVAAIAGVTGIASVSNAVNLNSDGLGQVLVYPYYTVNNGLNTLISVVNTTDEVKAIKVRFLEGKNSRECLDFNLYMSPYDVWTAGLVPTTSTAGAVGSANAGEPSVKLVTSDTSCTAPAINNQEFLPYAFTGDFADGISSSLERCTEGHFEMIEMGVVTNTGTNGAAQDAATHVGGTPASCGTIVNNWNGGAWIADSTDGVSAPTGGLFGSATLIDVTDGVDVGYNADAIDAFTSTVNHSDPGSLLPNLGTGDNQQSNIFNGGALVQDTWVDSHTYDGSAGGVSTGNSSGVQAVSALYMHDTIYGEYAVEVANAKTEWVVTFPTKWAYVDSVGVVSGGLGTALDLPIMPFTTSISSIGACEPYAVTGLYDREETTPSTPPGSVIPSPTPPGVDPTIPVFCWETNVLEFNKDAALTGDSLILGSKNTTHLVTPYQTGWVSVAFAQYAPATDVAGGLTQYNGLPVTGFAIQKYTNNNLAGGILANYAGLFAHRYSRSFN